MMEYLMHIIYGFSQAALLLLLAPLTSGMIYKCRAFLQNRSGSPLLQDYYDLRKWWSRPCVLYPEASFFFTAAPCVYFATVAVAACMLPLLADDGGVPGDIFVFIFVIALGRFFLLAASFDAPAAFGSMGAARELYVAAGAEPLLLLAMLTNTLHSGSTLPAGMAAGLGGHMTVAGILAGGSFFFVLLAENSRLPVDDLRGRLPLAMAHEALSLHYSGRLLALLRWADQLKLLLYLLLFALLFMPVDIWLPLKVLLAVLALAIVETVYNQTPLYKKTPFHLAAILLLLAVIAQ